MDGKDYYRRKSRRPYPWDALQHYQLEKDILSDECDKDSGYEPEQVNFWARNGSAANRANFRQKKQRSLDVHDVSADYYALLSPRLGSDSSYQNYDPSYHDTSLYNQIRYQSLDRPVKRRRKVPESILKNGYNSLPRGSSSLLRQENLSNSNISQSRNSVKFASPVRYSVTSDTVDTAIPTTCNGNGNANINLSNEASKATSDALTLRSVTSTFPFVEPGDSNISVNGVTAYDPSSQVEDKWKTSGTESTNGLQSCGNGQFSQNYSSNNGNNGNVKRYSDNDHYLRKSASVQIIAHEPSRCEGCFDGRLPLLLIVVFIGLVLFLLCIGVILDAEVFTGKDMEESTSKIHQTTESSIACQKLECIHGATCKLDSNEVASCHCSFQCPKGVKSVCGSDGLTYDNDCERKSAQCKLKTTIELAKTGPCVKDPCENVFCPSTQKCLPSFDGASARCVCKGPCSENVRPTEAVCGSDGLDYPSLCHLEKESCTKQNNLTKVYNGSCNPCRGIWCSEDKECKVDQSRTPNCSCVASCIDVVKPVCASNGKTYRNQCTMKQDSCKLEIDLIVVHSGVCNKESVCARLNCNPLAECHKDPSGLVECICPKCPPVYSPVCGNNNLTYNSECELYRTSCVSNGDLKLDYFGTCKARPCLKSECKAPHSLCGTEPKDATRTVCRCPSCGHSFNPVCGNNRILYDNLCLLQKDACKSKKTIKRQPLPFCDAASSSTKEESGTKQQTLKISLEPMIPRTTKTTTALILTTKTKSTTTTTTTTTTTPKQYVHFYERPPLTDHPEEPDIYSVYNEAFTIADKNSNLGTDCSSNPCQDGGTCEDHDGTFTCFCSEKRSGRFCQTPVYSPKLHIPAFSGQSYIELQTMRHVEHKTSIYIEFKTLRHDGQILYIEQEGEESGRDFLSVAIVNGFVEFRYNLGSGPAVLRSLKKVILGMWHSVSVKRWHQDSVLVLDSDPEVLGSVHGILKSLDLTSSTYIGYAPPTLDQAVTNIGTSKGLVGCMRKIKLGHRTIRFHFDHEPVFKSAFQISECSDKLCQDVTCYNQGICIEFNGEAKCECAAPYFGVQCTEVTEVADFQMNQINEIDEKESQKWTPDCSIGECHVPDFNGQSFLEFNTLDNVAKYADIEVWFLTRSTNGVLLYNGGKSSGSGDYISINLINGIVQLSYDLGSGVAKISSLRPVTLNTWHKVRIIRNGLESNLQLDSDPYVSGRSPAPMTSLNLGEPLMIGGFRHLYSVSVESGVVMGLDGAIQRVIINGETTVNLLRKAIDSKNIRDYKGAPCGNKPCENDGICVPNFRKAACICRRGFRGKYCKQRDTG